MTFVKECIVRFAHVDAAGIVFYPRYFEMLNAAVEDFFAESVGVDFATLHLDRRIGVPTVRLETDFHAPSRLGHKLKIKLSTERVGKSSCTIGFDVSCQGEQRLTATAVLVCVELNTGRSLAWPDEVRRRLSENLSNAGVSPVAP